jgi:hypothetical protein
MRRRERHGDAAGQPDRARDDDVREAWRDEIRDARFTQIPASVLGGERGGDTRGSLREIEMRKDAVGGDDGEAVGSDGSFSHCRRRTVRQVARHSAPGATARPC